LFAAKRELLGVSELSDYELKGNSALAVADRAFELLAKHRARTFVIWTANPDLLSLRNPQSASLSDPYRVLLRSMREYAAREHSESLVSLNFDQRGLAEDEAAACAISNYLFRTDSEWRRRFVIIPDFTVSSISPGLQIADLVTYLGPHFSDRNERPELSQFLGRVRGLSYRYSRGNREYGTIRKVR